jgi:hypothetical protein
MGLNERNDRILSENFNRLGGGQNG